MASELRFADVRRDLEANGWRMVRVRGSHHIFKKTGESPLTIPVHNNKVKPCYGKKIAKASGKKD